MALRCCRRFADRLAELSAKEGDSPVELARKRLSAPMYFGAFIMVCVVALNGNFPPDSWDSWLVGVFLALVCTSISFCLVMFSRFPAHQIAAGLAIPATVAVLCWDLNGAASGGQRTWSVCVLILDLSLVIGVSEQVQKVVIAITLAYLTVERGEAVFKFGLYEMSYGGTVPLGDIWLCNCEDPVCAVPVANAANQLCAVTFIFVADFILTRGFAIGLRHQVALVDASVAAAERVAVLLAGYSVEEAELVVEKDGDTMPPALRDALTLLLSNLKSYRPYLPDSLLHQLKEEMGAAAEPVREPLVEAPGLGAPGGRAHVCLCFTDIESSTALWEAYPQDMYEALQIHNRVIRSTAAANKGYECKTIGDAFMLCFDSAGSACRFALCMQLRLLAQQWPPDLLGHELCRPAAGIWNGLRVRAGLNFGQAVVQSNPITGRCDYFGSTVNVAARVEAAVRRGGLVGITDDVLAALGETGLAELGSPAVIHAGTRVLKGVREPVGLHYLLPPELAARAEPAHSAAPTPVMPSPAGQSPVSVLMSTVGMPLPEPLLMRDDSETMSDPLPSQRSSATGRSSVLRSMSAAMGAHSSPGSFRRRPSNLTHRLGALGLRLQRTGASCAVLRTPLRLILEQEGRLNAHCSAIDSAADASGGVVVVVLSGGAVVCWNAGRPCANHAPACAHFVQTILRDPRAYQSHCGAASGEVLSGNIAAGRRRFATVIGSCVELAAALAEEAELCGDAALAQGPAVGVFAEAGRAFRAQLWQDTAHAGGFVVWELSTSSSKTVPDPSAEADDCLGRSLLLPPAAQDTVLEAEIGGEWADRIGGAFHAATELSGAEQQAVLEELFEALPKGMYQADRLLQRAARGVLRTRRTAPLPGLDLFHGSL